jgi:hypothetical protein
METKSRKQFIIYCQEIKTTFNLSVVYLIYGEIMFKLGSDDIDFIDNVRKNLNTQNDRSTSYPLFCVFEKKEIVVDGEYDFDYEVFVDEEDSENYVNCNDEEWQLKFIEVFEDEIEDFIEEMKETNQWDEEEYDLTDKEEIKRFVDKITNISCSFLYDWGYAIRKIYIKENDEFVTACFTEEGANNYLKINGHNLKKPFIYVTSLYRNEEMITIRNLLKGY